MRNAILDQLEATIGTLAVLKIRTGAAPPTVATADSGTVLATLSLPSDWMAAASSGAKALAGAWQDTSADATGTAAHFRIYASDGTTAHIQGTVGTSGTDMIVDSASFTATQSFTVNSFTLTAPGAEMPDDVIINAGSGGDTIAADDIGGKKHQRVKLVMGADGVSESDLASGNPMPVRGYAFDAPVSITRPLDTTTYIIGDCFSNSTSAPTSGGFLLSSVARASGGSGVLTDIFITSSANAAMQGKVYIFNQAVTNKNDNASLAISAADMRNCVGSYDFTLEPEGSCSSAHLQNLGKAFTCFGSPDLRLLVKLTAAYTPISGEVLQIRAQGLQAT